MAGEADHPPGADTVISLPRRFALPYLGQRGGEEYHKPVHRPPLKYSSDQQLLPLLASSLAKGYACGFGYYAAEFLCILFIVEGLPPNSVRDIYNLTIAGGLGFGALHIFSAENLVAVTKQQSRLLGRLPLMVAIGAAVGSFAHAAEFAFYHITTMAGKKVVKLESPAGSSGH